MARPARFRIPDIADLLRQIRYAAASVKARQLQAAEAFVRDIEPHRLYARSDVIHRITGYRPDVDTSKDSEPSYVGEPLRADLVNFIVTLSGHLDLSPNHRDRTAIDVETLAARLNVSSRTLHRYRQRGLVLHMVHFPRRGKRLACFEDAWNHFANHHFALVDQATRFSRLDASTRQSIIDDAARMCERDNVTLNEAATRLAEQHGRALETMRGILKRHDRRSNTPIFCEHGPLTDRDLRFITRARRFGINAGTLARRFGKSTTIIHRAQHHYHARKLRDLSITVIELPTFRLPDAESVILGHPAVQRGPMSGQPGAARHGDALADDLPIERETDALQLINRLRAESEPDPDTVDALTAAYNLLKYRARQAISELPGWPTSRAIDAIETDLRWATRLKVRLIACALPQPLRTIDMHVGRGLDAEPSETIVRLLRAAVDECSDVVEQFNPSRGTRAPNLRRIAGYAMDRRLGREPAGVRGRAAARHSDQSIEITDLFAATCAWQQLVDLSPRLQRVVDRLDEDARDLLTLRYGLGDRAPLGLDALARMHETTITGISRRLSEAEVALRRGGSS